jgi:thioredoxin-like negative regulator of GroEL
MKRHILLTCCLLASLLSGLVRADTASAVRAALASGQPALIEFGAETCSQCKRMKVVLDGVSQRYKGRAHVVQVKIGRAHV